MQVCLVQSVQSKVCMLYYALFEHLYTHTHVFNIRAGWYDKIHYFIFFYHIGFLGIGFFSFFTQDCLYTSVIFF